MKIDSIKLKNFKCFEGFIEINSLNSSAEKPIVLFGGLNGAGKTSLLEAVLLCLYGEKNKSLFPTKGTRKEDYPNYICSITNNKSKEPFVKPTVSVELNLSEVDIGISQSISIKRTWIVNLEQKSVSKETVEIRDSNGEDIGVVSPENYNEFIDSELIPYDISQFFLFDGEKIQDFVRDEDKAFAESLEKALGLNIYETLKEDVDKTRREILTDYNKDKDATLQIKTLDTDIERLKQETESTEEKIENLQLLANKNDERIAEIDRETLRITYKTSENRESYESEKDKLNQEKGKLETEISSTIQDIPFAMIASLCENLNEQLQKEFQLQNAKSAQKSLEPKINHITHKVFDESQCFPPLSDFQRGFYVDKLSRTLMEVLREIPAELKDVIILHDVSSYNASQIKHRTKTAWENTSSLSRLAQRYTEIEPTINKISQSENRGNSPEVNRLFEEKGKLNSETEQIKKDIVDVHQVTIQKCKDEIIAKNRQITELEKKLEKTSKMKKQIEYCEKLKETIAEFSHRFRSQRVEKLETLTLEMLQNLARKKDFVSKVVIDPKDNFSIKLFDSRNSLIDKTKISAGEKEIMAISLIWAMGKLANRELPLMIDTPLARLDSEHRQHIIEKYYPKASQQVILLSTDTEIIGENYEAIKPYVSKSYLIEKKSSEESTTIKEGYFA
jgi:DNA sulfur modification protein DndD